MKKHEGLELTVVFINLHSRCSPYSYFSVCRSSDFQLEFFDWVEMLFLVHVLHTSVNKCQMQMTGDLNPISSKNSPITPFRLPGGPQSQEAHQVVLSEPDTKAESRHELPHAGGGTSSRDEHAWRDFWRTLRVSNTDQQPAASHSLDSCAFTRLVWIKATWGNKLRAL